MGNKNDYLTLEESARVLNRPVPLLNALISEGKLSAKSVGGRWQISNRELDKLKRSPLPEPEKVVHNFLADIPPKNSQRVPEAKPETKAKKATATESRASKSRPTESDPEKRIKELYEQIVNINEQMRTEEKKNRKGARSGSHSSKTFLDKLLFKRELLKKQLLAAINKRAHPGKKQTKKTAKKPSSKSTSWVDDLRGRRRLLDQVKALDGQIWLAVRKHEAAAQEGRSYESEFYGTEALERMVSQRENLAREYAKIPDPLGLLPPLPPLPSASTREACQETSKAPKRSLDQTSPPAEVPKVLPPSGLPTSYLPWRLLPPGELSIGTVIRHYDRLQRQYPDVKYERERIEKAHSLNPKQCYVGKNELEWYTVFTFAHTPKALLECPVSGNAIYIIKSDWERLSRLTKQELMRSREVTRIIHRGAWFRRVKRALGIR